MTTLPITNSTNRSLLRRAFVLSSPVLACLALLPAAQAVSPAPDGGYAGNNTAEGSSSLFNLTTGTNNTALGFTALFSDTTGSFNTATGSAALQNNNGTRNTADGYQALFHNKGSNNTAVGVSSLSSNTTGTQNVAVGQEALGANNADGNVGVGSQALKSNTTGGSHGMGANTATGLQALFHNSTGDGNTATGDAALLDNTSGVQNTAIGVDALAVNSTGATNTAIGAFALEFTKGNSNVGVGFLAGAGSNGSNDIYIGNEGVIESNTIRIGDVQTRTFMAGIRGRTTGVANAVPVLIDSNGQLGTASSSRRFKKEIKPMDKESEAILSLKPVTFHYKSDASATPQFGLIAEEVAKVNHDLVVCDDNGEIYTVRYDAVNAMLLNEFLKEHKAFVEEQRKVQQQEKTIAELKSGMEALAATVKEQAAQIQKVSAQLEMSKPTPQVVVNN